MGKIYKSRRNTRYKSEFLQASKELAEARLDSETAGALTHDAERLAKRAHSLGMKALGKHHKVNRGSLETAALRSMHMADLKRPGELVLIDQPNAREDLNNQIAERDGINIARDFINFASGDPNQSDFKAFFTLSDPLSSRIHEHFLDELEPFSFVDRSVPRPGPNQVLQLDDVTLVRYGYDAVDEQASLDSTAAIDSVYYYAVRKQPTEYAPL